MKSLYSAACLLLLNLTACDPVSKQSVEFEVTAWPGGDRIVVDASQMGDAATAKPTASRYGTAGASDRTTYKFDQSIKVIVVPLDDPPKPND